MGLQRVWHDWVTNTHWSCVYDGTHTQLLWCGVPPSASSVSKNIAYGADSLLNKVLALYNLLMWNLGVSVSQFSHSVISDFFATPWLAAHQASLSITNSWSLLKLMPIELVMPSSHLILCRPLLLLPPIPPSIRVFSGESAFHMRWSKYWSFSFKTFLSVLY